MIVLGMVGLAIQDHHVRFPSADGVPNQILRAISKAHHVRLT